MKNYITEFIGTFFLVLTIGLTKDPLAIGVMLTVMVYMGGHISGAHYNPAVSIAMIFRGILTTKEAVKYILSQLAGAFLAAVFVQWVQGSCMQITPQGPSATVMQILAVESIFTFALVLVILNVATNPKTEGNSYYGLAIGFTVMAAAYAGGQISGGAYNPAVGTGPMLFEALYVEWENIWAGALTEWNALSTLWHYLVGPIVGAVLATYVYKLTTD